MAAKRTRPVRKTVRNTAGAKPVRKTGIKAKKTRESSTNPAGAKPRNEHHGCKGCPNKKTAETKAKEAQKTAEAKEAQKTAEAKEAQKTAEAAMGQILDIETEKFVINSLARVDIDEILAIAEARRRTARAIAGINKNAARAMAAADEEAARAMAAADEAEAKAIAGIERRAIDKTAQTVRTFNSPLGEIPLKEGDTCILASEEKKEYPIIMTLVNIGGTNSTMGNCCWNERGFRRYESFPLSALRHYTAEDKN